MSLAYSNTPKIAYFSEAQLQLKDMISYLESERVTKLEHGEIEKYINIEGTEVLRKLLQGYFDMKAAGEEYQSVCADDGTQLTHKKIGCSRNLESLFGQVSVKRSGYSQRRYWVCSLNNVRFCI